ncbi:MAG: GatB/YqeY domain-containing protein, partial [Chromatiales bacterium]|nr:GatB/YqeY domain-containing protein [Chromatiales bacterium]
ITVLQACLPEPLSEGEVESLIEEAIQTTGASSMRDMGNVMSELRAAAHGRVDMAVASARVKSRLARN